MHHHCPGLATLFLPHSCRGLLTSLSSYTVDSSQYSNTGAGDLYQKFNQIMSFLCSNLPPHSEKFQISHHNLLQGHLALTQHLLSPCPKLWPPFFLHPSSLPSLPLPEPGPPPQGSPWPPPHLTQSPPNIPSSEGSLLTPRLK